IRVDAPSRVCTGARPHAARAGRPLPAEAGPALAGQSRGRLPTADAQPRAVSHQPSAADRPPAAHGP
ncbi:hypothetical protein ABZX90_09370, partial [Streptomyces sp. NPDC002935]